MGVFSMVSDWYWWCSHLMGCNCNIRCLDCPMIQSSFGKHPVVNLYQWLVKKKKKKKMKNFGAVVGSSVQAGCFHSEDSTIERTFVVVTSWSCAVNIHYSLLLLCLVFCYVLEIP